MLAIGRALLTNPKLLIMDEPSEGLAPTIVESLIETLERRLSPRESDLLLVEQNLGVATAVAERQLVMVAGRIFTETTAAALQADPDLQQRFLGVTRVEHGVGSSRQRALKGWAAAMATVVLLGTLDTKGQEYAYLRDRVREHGVDVAPRRRRRPRRAARSSPTSRAQEVAAAAGADVAALAAAGDRGARRRDDGTRRRRGREAAPRRGTARWRRRRSAARAARRSPRYAMRALPVGVPKLMVSTVASGDTRPYVGAVDVTMMYSVVDIAGHQPDLGPDPRERRGRDRRHGEGDGAAAGRTRSRSSALRCSASRRRA